MGRYIFWYRSTVLERPPTPFCEIKGWGGVLELDVVFGEEVFGFFGWGGFRVCEAACDAVAKAVVPVVLRKFAGVLSGGVVGVSGSAVVVVVNFVPPPSTGRAAV